MTNSTNSTGFVPGLAGVVAAQTRLSSVNGLEGELIIAGFPLEEIASQATFEEVAYLLWNDTLPTPVELDKFRQALAAERVLPNATVEILRAAVQYRLPPMDALLLAASTLSLDLAKSDPSHQAVAVLARFPMIVATYMRLLNGQNILSPRDDLGQAANYLYMLFGEVPRPEEVRGLETYLNTVVDHGLNASTFTARVIISTGSDLVSAVVGAIGALKGPLHGGAPGPALDMVFEIGEASRAETIMRGKLERRERLMGFGHRVYRTRDPRAEVLSLAAERMFRQSGDMALYTLAREVENVAVRLLAERYPDRNLKTNVEFYTALLLHGLGFSSDLFTPTFAISRVAGWIAHILEQRQQSRIIRPESEYIGVRDRHWIPLDQR
ncbi:MAG TPA: citrate synthase/methylcitrate synthase [Anaerolineales bacterium]|nr:citrate synthase/methylcitrate synthase [Anaerolineales bacterium]HLO27688.1 citrate synthase/methylcitrate synthase [Anaerolineales bacterium]